MNPHEYVLLCQEQQRFSQARVDGFLAAKAWRRVGKTGQITIRGLEVADLLAPV